MACNYKFIYQIIDHTHNGTNYTLYMANENDINMLSIIILLCIILVDT